ncbi:MAG: IS200/IS605 family transposase, partial [Chloroflexi bacterium]|nr:IS200/IS605 family transposase [Chloroflexota bacterium]
MMPLWQLFYHIVWSTKGRAPILQPDVEPLVYDLVRSKATGLGAVVYALNGMPDHVHLVVAIPPKIAVAQFIGQVKGVAAARFNKREGCLTPLYWQSEYAVFSLDSKRLSNHVAYVNAQKVHHRQRTTIPLLERTATRGHKCRTLQNDA